MRKKSIKNQTELVGTEKRYTYFAFISYKREDSKWARWLQNKLSTYRLPNRLIKQYEDLQERCSPVFLDKTDLRPGLLEESLRSEIGDSKYMIIICSENACRNSKYIDMEIQLFLNCGGSTERIIPFIVDPSDKPEEECFPKRLVELCEEHNIVGANVYELGKRRAFLKVVAYMHGLKVQELESQDSLVRRRKFITGGCLSTAAIALLVVGVYRYWDYNVPKTQYYLDYTEVMGIPVGIVPLNAETADTMEGHYTIISSKGKVRELKHENSYGKLTKSSDIAHADRPVWMKYEYLENDQLASATQFDEEGNPLCLMEYGKSLRYIDLLDYNDSYGSGRYRETHTIGEEEKLYDMETVEEDVDPYMLEEGTRTKIQRYIVDYDDKGYISEVHYASVMNTAVLDADGVGGLRFERDDLGRITRIWYLTCTGSGSSAIDPGQYAVRGTLNGLYSKQYVYDQDGNIEEIRYLGKDDKPVNYYLNASTIQRKFSDYNILEEQYLDAVGNPVINTDLYASYTAVHDEKGNQIQKSYYDTKGNLTYRENRYVIYRQEFDENGNVIFTGCYDESEKPVLNGEGFSQRVYEYDSDNRKIATRYFGTDDKPVINEYGYAVCALDYDDAGHVSHIRYFGTDGNPVIADDLCAVSYNVYDENGNIIRDGYMGLEGEPVIGINGYASCVREYDERGNETGEFYYDTDGSPMPMNGDLYSGHSYTYDERRNLTGVIWLGPDGGPAELLDGYSGVAIEYDERGNMTRIQYLDTAMAPVVNSALGYSSVIIDYDEKGNRTRKRFFDASDKPILCINGYASCEYRSDDRGNEIEIRYFGMDGEPTFDCGGAACVKNVYDECQNFIELSFYGIHDEPILYDDGGMLYSSMRMTYDTRGNCTGTAFLGIEGEPVMVQDGDFSYSSVSMEYDDTNCECHDTYYDANGAIIDEVFLEE